MPRRMEVRMDGWTKDGRMQETYRDWLLCRIHPYKFVTYLGLKIAVNTPDLAIPLTVDAKIHYKKLC